MKGITLLTVVVALAAFSSASRRRHGACKGTELLGKGKKATCGAAQLEYIINQTTFPELEALRTELRVETSELRAENKLLNQRLEAFINSSSALFEFANVNGTDFLDTGDETNNFQNFGQVIVNAFERVDSDTQSVELALSSQLSIEEARREDADSSLSSDVSSEEAVRKTADSSLSTDISSEISSRISGDASLSADISSEEMARQTAIANLSAEMSFDLMEQEGSVTFEIPRNGYVVEGNELTFFVGSSYYEFSSRTSMSMYATQKFIDDLTDSWDMDIEGGMSCSSPWNGDGITWEDAQGGGFFLSMSQNCTGFNVDVNVLLLDGAVRRDYHITATNAANTSVEFELFDHYGSSSSIQCLGQEDRDDIYGGNDLVGSNYTVFSRTVNVSINNDPDDRLEHRSQVICVIDGDDEDFGITNPYHVIAASGDKADLFFWGGSVTDIDARFTDVEFSMGETKVFTVFTLLDKRTGLGFLERGFEPFDTLDSIAEHYPFLAYRLPEDNVYNW